LPAAADARLEDRPRGFSAVETPFGGGEYGGGGCSDWARRWEEYVDALPGVLRSRSEAYLDFPANVLATMCQLCTREGVKGGGHVFGLFL
jgi:hypothetical protein